MRSYLRGNPLMDYIMVAAGLVFIVLMVFVHPAKEEHLAKACAESGWVRR